MTKNDLKEYAFLIDNIDRLEEDLLRIENQAQKVTTQLTGMPRGTNDTDKLCGLICAMDEVKNKINTKLAQAYTYRCYVEDGIERLSETQKKLIRLRYIDRMRWEKICVEMNYEWAQIHRLHKQALRDLS